MKSALILFCMLASAFAVERKTSPDMREGTKAVDEKYLKALEGVDVKKREPQSRVHQIDSKRARQFQEERPRSQSSQ